jgi:branched-chain amino acid transport system permease protein
MSSTALTNPPPAREHEHRGIKAPFGATWKNLVIWVIALLVLSMLSGPSGNSSQEWYGVHQSLLSPRALAFAVVGVVLWLLSALASAYSQPLHRVIAPLTGVRARINSDQRVKVIVFAAAFLGAIFIPPLLSQFWQEVLVDQIAIYVLLALGLNVVVGFAGLLDLGYVAFFAIGAYTAAYWTGSLPAKPPFVINIWFTFPFSMAACVAAGLLLGAPTLRLRGDYLAIVTLGFGEIVRIFATNASSITGGPQGAVNIPHFSLFGHSFALNNLDYWYLILAVIIMVIVFFSRLEDSRVGRSWTAIREDEPAAEASGVPLVKYKLMAFAIGASTSGLAGVIYASKIGYINPGNFTLNVSILVLACVIFGGMGSIWGVVIGTAIVEWLPNFLRNYVPPDDRIAYFGALLVLMMIFRPQGLIPSRRRTREIQIEEEERAMEGGTVT